MNRELYDWTVGCRTSKEMKGVRDTFDRPRLEWTTFYVANPITAGMTTNPAQAHRFKDYREARQWAYRYRQWQGQDYTTLQVRKVGSVV